MTTIYVAKSESLQEWGDDVGLTKHLYKVGVAEGDADSAIETLNGSGYGGRNDWKLVKKQDVDDVEEEAAIARVARRETMVDPNYYPKIKRARGVFKVNVTGLEQSILVQNALAGEVKVQKLKEGDIAAHLLRSAAG